MEAVGGTKYILNKSGVVGLEEKRKVQGGGTVVCLECGKAFYGNKQREFCNECLKERARVRSKKRREKLKAEKSLRHFVTSPFRAREAKGVVEGNVYISAEERFGISSETGKIFSFVREVGEYNRLHGTRLSYGQYENMIFLEREKRLKEIKAKKALKIGAILQSQGASEKEVEKAYDSIGKRGKKK